MKGTAQRLFSLHQRDCVKCQRLHEVRTGQMCDPTYFILLKIHEDNMKLLYGLTTLKEWLEEPWMNLPTE